MVPDAVSESVVAGMDPVLWSLLEKVRSHAVVEQFLRTPQQEYVRFHDLKLLVRAPALVAILKSDSPCHLPPVKRSHGA